MDLNAAQMLVAVVRAGSLSAAAQRSGIPLATLSRNLKLLERRLGVQLLERSPRGAKLTEAGMAFYEHASRGVDALHDGELAATRRQATIQGRLRLSIPPRVRTVVGSAGGVSGPVSRGAGGGLHH